MTERVFRYVPHEHFETYQKAGWTHDPCGMGTHHDAYSTLMEWTGPGEPPDPLKEVSERQDSSKMTRLEWARFRLEIWRQRLSVVEAGVHQARLAVLAAEDEERSRV